MTPAVNLANRAVSWTARAHLRTLNQCCTLIPDVLEPAVLLQLKQVGSVEFWWLSSESVCTVELLCCCRASNCHVVACQMHFCKISVDISYPSLPCVSSEWILRHPLHSFSLGWGSLPCAQGSGIKEEHLEMFIDTCSFAASTSSLGSFVDLTEHNEESSATIGRGDKYSSYCLGVNHLDRLDRRNRIGCRGPWRVNENVT